MLDEKYLKSVKYTIQMCIEDYSIRSFQCLYATTNSIIKWINVVDIALIIHFFHFYFLSVCLISQYLLS